MQKFDKNHALREVEKAAALRIQRVNESVASVIHLAEQNAIAVEESNATQDQINRAMIELQEVSCDCETRIATERQDSAKMVERVQISQDGMVILDEPLDCRGRSLLAGARLSPEAAEGIQRFINQIATPKKKLFGGCLNVSKVMPFVRQFADKHWKAASAVVASGCIAAGGFYYWQNVYVPRNEGIQYKGAPSMGSVLEMDIDPSKLEAPNSPSQAPKSSEKANHGLHQ